MRFFKQAEMYDSIYFYKLHPNEYSQEFCYYPFAVKLDRCVGSCNTINDLSKNVYVPNKTEDLSVFNMITAINGSKILANTYQVNINVDFMKENVFQINGGIMINVDVSVKNVMCVKKKLCLESCYMYL